MTAAISTSQVTLRSGRVRRALLLTGLGVFGGLLLAVLWSADLVDDQIGQNVATGVLGHNAQNTAINTATGGAVFALVSGFAGTFTACNVAVFGALPDVTACSSARSRLAAALAPIGWMITGLVTVSALYGVIAVLLGHDLPQLSTRLLSDGIPVRLVQSMIAFGIVGLTFGYLGLTSLGLLRDPLAGRPRTRMVVLGALVGAFLIGRPYPLFHKLVDYAVGTHNPLIGALTFALQSFGNVLLVLALGLVFAWLARGRAGRWLAEPGHTAAIAGVALIALGTFLLVYWDIRLPSHFGYGWFPTMPWNS